MIAGRHLLSLIEDLLDISSIEAGGSDLVLEEVAIGEVAQEVRRLVAPLVDTAGLTLVIDASTEQATAWADRRRIVQVLLNLLANAAKYHESGSRIRLGCKLQGELVRIEVEDDGRGIAPRDVPRLFTPFDRLDQQKNGRIAGTGLGLALSRQLVQSMGGEIGFEPATPGALFWFTLPAANPSKAG
jgi:signal transduction histidine kinase